MNYENLYKTKDQFLAAVLYALKQKLISTEYDNKNCYFFFDNNDECEDLVSKYFTNDLLVNPKDFVDAYKTVKTIIYR